MRPLILNPNKKITIGATARRNHPSRHGARGGQPAENRRTPSKKSNLPLVADYTWAIYILMAIYIIFTRGWEEYIYIYTCTYYTQYRRRSRYTEKYKIAKEKLKEEKLKEKTKTENTQTYLGSFADYVFPLFYRFTSLFL